MPTLTDEIKTFIVKGLACYDTPSQVAEAVKAEFGLEVSRQQVYVYDPGCSQPPAQRWRDLHAATRAALLRELGEIGIAHRAVRPPEIGSHGQPLRAQQRPDGAQMPGDGGEGVRRHVREPQADRLQPSLPQSALPEPAPQPVATPPAPPQPAAAQAARPQPAAKRPARPQPAAARAAEPPLPSAPPLLAPQPSLPERAAPQVAAPQVAVPQPATALSAPLPLAVLAQPPQTPGSPEGRPLSRVERHLAYVRDRHARDRAVAAEARLNKG
jgi:hypothetical protein